MIMNAPAKINLFLAIDAKRPDGYHELRTILHKITLEDYLEIEPADSLSLEVRGIEIPNNGENLVLKAARLYSQKYDTGMARIVLHKNIPSGAGLGGGSSDAAATLKALHRMYGKGNKGELIQLAKRLGADVPFFLEGQSSFATGIGTEIAPLPSVDLGWVLLVKPKASLSTPTVYQELSPEDYRIKTESETILRGFYDNDISLIADSLYNSLEAPAFRLLPELAEIKNKLLELGGKPLMSGSGSALFALFSNKDDAKNALNAIEPFGAWSGIFRSGEDI